MSALFNIGYGLYVITSHDGKHDNGFVGNAVAQVALSPNRIMVSINKANYSHDVIKETGKMNVNCLSVDAPFSVFENFGFKSGRDTDKFADGVAKRSANGLAVLPNYVNACISLQVEEYVDLGSHGMFLCSVTEEMVLGEKETMTYTYYQNHVKPKPAAPANSSKKSWVCKICGWVYEGEELPDDLICPLCKHPASDFEPLS